MRATGMGLMVLMGSAALASIARASTDTQSAALTRFASEQPQAHLRYDETGTRIIQVWGRAFSSGQSAQDAAFAFVDQYADIFDVPAENLINTGALDVRNGAFTVFYFDQFHDGLRVDESGMAVLVRSDDNGVVLVNADLRSIPDGFSTNPGIDEVAASRIVQAEYSHLNLYSEPQLVVYTLTGTPTLAWKMTASNDDAAHYENWLVYVDAQDGSIVARHDGVLHTDISGNVQGKATPGLKPDEAINPPVMRAIGDAHITNSSNGAQTYTDDNGNYTVTNAGNSAVTITVDLNGRVIDVDNMGTGGELSASQSVTPPGPGNFTLNNSPTEFVTAQVNALVKLHETNELMLSINGSYPITEKRKAKVNISGTCNAFYDINGDLSTNFYRAGGGCPNMAYSTVAWHEYGHHIVEKGHTNAWPAYPDYHEGMADAAAALTGNNPCVGEDFFGQNTGCLRNGDTANRQYPCGGEGHFCGEVISGCTWHTLEALNLDGFDGLTLTRDLWLNSILLHPPGIQPGIAVDWATLDDDDGNIDNGSPHYAQIDAGFSQHNMGLPIIDTRCEDLKKFTATCRSGGKVIAKCVFTDDSHVGETVTFNIAGTPVVTPIVGRRAKTSLCCYSAGPKTVKLTDPAGCKSDLTATCP